MRRSSTLQAVCNDVLYKSIFTLLLYASLVEELPAKIAVELHKNDLISDPLKQEHMTLQSFFS